jgi:hypothetical protein
MRMRSPGGREPFRRNRGTRPRGNSKSGASTMTHKTGPPRRRSQRVQVMMSHDEMAEIEDFRYRTRMPSQASAVRELLRRGLAAIKKEN